MVKISSLIICFVTAVLILSFPNSSVAQDCGGIYEVQRGDSLSRIASVHYDDFRKWSLIYQANIREIGQDPDLIMIGARFRIPCIERGEAERQAALRSGTEGWRSDGSAAVRLLTADDYAPFTDRGLPNGGLVTELVEAAFRENDAINDFGLTWINDWSVHLSPMLTERTYDMGFPWLRPDCAGDPENYRCSQFVFSEPMFEMLVLLYVAKDRPFAFRDDDDVLGKTLCRPSGYYTHDLNKDGRNWLKSGAIELVQPDTVDACFRLLLEGKADAVALNEFTGRESINRLGIENKVEIIQTRPLSIEGLHVLVHKDHPEAETLIKYVNDGLAEIRASGTYNAVLDKHLAAFWQGLE